MPAVLTEASSLHCGHNLGKVGIEPSQDLVRIEGKRLLIQPDPEQRPIHGCPNVSTSTKACQKTTSKVRTGYSEFVRVLGHPIVLANLVGETNGSPPAGATYSVADVAQDLVETSA
ncbi:MAG TPA: hypothetical protein VEJ84_02560 [Acidimicrobiales bacterium]|nr:hypothetical protein [Acidimicrobiales bacterium]